MNNKEIAALLEETAVLMELSDENPFKIRAYQNAARTITALPEDVKTLIDEKRITQVKGIGKGLAGDLAELINTGTLPAYENLKNKFPQTLFQLFRIPGLGPKRIKILYKKRNINSLITLEYACRHNNLLDLDGFGQKTQQKILKGIEQVKRYAEKFHLPKAKAEAERIIEMLSGLPGVRKTEIAGSLRRSKETVKDIDILVSAEEGARAGIMDAFTSNDQVVDIIGKGDTKSSIKLKSGINCDLRIIAEEQFPFALLYFTGSKDHNTVVRAHAKKQGLKLNEYGLFEGETSRRCSDESDIYTTLGFAYIPPELRENTGEIDAAAENRLPVLVQNGDIRGIIHVHSTWSDGYSSIEELARFLKKEGYAYLGISDHSKSAFYANGLTDERVIAQMEEIDEINRKLDGFTVFKGIESDILADGSLDYPDEILQRFDFVIASIHSRFNMTEEEATDRLITAVRNPYTTILGHPTGRLLLGRSGYPVNMFKVIDAAAKAGKIIELNANYYRLDIDWRLLPYAKNKNVRISINPDAHRIEGFQDIRTGVSVARKGWLEKGDVLNTRSAEEVGEIFRTIKAGE